MQRRATRVPLCRGITLVECILVFAIVIVLLVVFILSPGWSPRRANSMQLKDGAYLKSVHMSWIIFSNDFNGIYPTLGLVDRLPINGVETPGRGDEDVTKNTTANVFSLLIMNNYLKPDFCVSPSEPSAKVTVFDEFAYDFMAYSPASGTFWDPAFTADLAIGSNVSYAHLPLIGARRLSQWRYTRDASFAIVGNRGPRDGTDPNSITYKIHKPFDRWTGNVVFNDNSRQFIDAEANPDVLSLFKLPVPHLGFTKSIALDGQSAEFDWD